MYYCFLMTAPLYIYDLSSPFIFIFDVINDVLHRTVCPSALHVAC